jgi:2-polyprenyl-3-methyl-5-hydroxy-6-metoxy-1,4-benzoquinol methylase
MSVRDETVTYYSRRASEYEAIYRRDNPIRRAEQIALETAMNASLKDRAVLEVACGTGYWTQRLAGHAQSIIAVDASIETLEIARSKTYPRENVEFRIGDAYKLEFTEQFDGGMANFWLSHVPKAQLETFIKGFHASLQPGARVFVADNVYFPAATTGVPFTKPGVEDAFALRTLEDGSQFEIIKNYYGPDDLEGIFAPHSTRLEIHVGTCFWWVSYTLKRPS